MKLAQQKTPQSYRPGLSSGISGTAFMGTSSVSSAVSSLPGQEDPLAPDSEDPPQLSLFESLRETIYSEVATLISQNENRPHFLIELFRELQLLSSDYLRQRALYSIQDLVTRFLTEEKITQPADKVCICISCFASPI
jgi:pericentriolar material 1 protein